MNTTSWLAAYALLMMTFGADASPRYEAKYLYVNASQATSLDVENGMLFIGEEGMQVVDCKADAKMPCFRIPYLSIAVSFPEGRIGRDSWRTGGNLFCLRKTFSLAKEYVYVIDAGSNGASCENLSRETSFVVSSKRGLLSFSGHGKSGAGISFTLLESVGFGGT